MKVTTIAFVLILFSSCVNDKVNTNIPDSYVNFGIDLQQYPDFRNGLGNYLVCPTDLYSKYGGFGYAGEIVLFHNLLNDVLAFDMCCTNPECVNKKIKVQIQTDGHAVCPSCGSTFNLLVGYADVVVGPAKYPLRMYKTFLSGEYIQVSRPN